MGELGRIGDGQLDPLDRVGIRALEAHRRATLVLDVGSAFHQFSFVASSRLPSASSRLFHSLR